MAMLIGRAEIGRTWGEGEGAGVPTAGYGQTENHNWKAMAHLRAVTLCSVSLCLVAEKTFQYGCGRWGWSWSAGWLGGIERVGTSGVADGIGPRAITCTEGVRNKVYQTQPTADWLRRSLWVYARCLYI